MQLLQKNESYIRAACISSARSMVSYVHIKDTIYMFSFCYRLTKSLWIKFLLSRYFIADDTWRTISVIWEDCRRVWFFRKKCKRHPRKYKPKYNSNKHRIITAISNVWAPYQNIVTIIVFQPKLQGKPNKNVELPKHLVMEQLTLGHELRDDINRLLAANTIELYKVRMLELPVTRYTKCFRDWSKRIGGWAGEAKGWVICFRTLGKGGSFNFQTSWKGWVMCFLTTTF